MTKEQQPWIVGRGGWVTSRATGREIGQVRRVPQFGADGHLLARTRWEARTGTKRAEMRLGANPTFPTRSEAAGYLYEAATSGATGMTEVR